VVGTVDALADGRYDVRYKLLDTVKQPRCPTWAGRAAQFTRLTAHRSPTTSSSS
jgi:TolB protein